ncbi:MAG TPA: hypothetical protein VL614_27040 [Acetobacteraceae bacterium]|jgi:hypothetical protein|nr:hypothetical protein [Acetobacteraceae bacterium]
MPIRLIPIAAAIALTACTPPVSQTAGYTYPDYWGTSASRAASPGGGPTAPGLPSTSDTQGSTALFGTHTAASPGVWLFPPDPYQ